MIDLVDILGAEGQALRERLGNTPGWDDRLKVAENFVLQRIGDTQVNPSPVAWAFRQIEASSGAVSIARLAERIGWSRKHLAARFDDEVGLGPKTLSRIVRFHRAIGMSRIEPHTGWADLAAACGYSDQAHLAREFRELAGATPSEWRRQHSSGG
jgi:AraC-like DNA-binding protein